MEISQDYPIEENAAHIFHGEKVGSGVRMHNFFHAPKLHTEVRMHLLGSKTLVQLEKSGQT